MTALAVGALLVLAGCSQERRSVPAACLGEPATVLAALARAPGAVVLRDGTRLSACVSRARTEADLQSLGASLLRVADTLRAQAASDPRAALRLGYLAGAVKAGATHSSGAIAAQLARRVEQAAALQPGASAAAAAALLRGRRAGESSG